MLKLAGGVLDLTRRVLGLAGGVLELTRRVLELMGRVLELAGGVVDLTRRVLELMGRVLDLPSWMLELTARGRGSGSWPAMARPGSKNRGLLLVELVAQFLGRPTLGVRHVMRRPTRCRRRACPGDLRPWSARPRVGGRTRGLQSVGLRTALQTRRGPELRLQGASLWGGRLEVRLVGRGLVDGGVGFGGGGLGEGRVRGMGRRGCGIRGWMRRQIRIRRLGRSCWTS